ncbi:GNAT family N-acetyltransferase [Sulfitobacter sp. F26169L]|uniref:GNAT family N-acetyltransferase n=1 Tax=Sulfitobacter sp. F26169L TaxID=2996015 RepID=UPI002260A11E|nr:GNAT family N-acetyltransferase [Sulfitobacter sp. F26169L]MCX7565813.1 GNAT family N-acetyltransferase [Sulfitobacter sp. F26169L]
MIDITETDDRQACYALRHTVFVQEQGYTAEGEVDALDPLSHHLLAQQNGTPVATARVYIAEGTAKIGRVCVLKELRGTGLGADLIRAAVELATRQGADHAILGAQVHAIGFYAKLGFEPYGHPYDDEGEPHQMMQRTL